LIPVAVRGPQFGGGRSGPNPDRLIEDWDAGPNFPGLKHETWGTHLRPENFDSSSFS